MILTDLTQIHEESRVPRILGGIIFPQILVFLFVLGRAISRIYVIGTWGWDDSLIIFAWLNSLVLTVFFGLGTLYGRHHIEDVPKQLAIDSLSMTYFTLICYQLALCFTKLSILVFYLRVFTSRLEKWLSWGTIVFVVCFGIPLLIGDVLQCNPITHQSFFSQNVVCFTAMPFRIASTVLHTVTDSWLILMIIPVVMQQKFVLMGVLSLGICVIIFSILRINSIQRVNNHSDIAWSFAEFDIWSVLEVATGLICACAPTIRPLVQKVFPKFIGSGASSFARTNPTTAGRPSSQIELAAPNLEGPTPFARRAGKDKKDSWLSESAGKERMILKQGRMVRRTDSMFTDTYGFSEPPEEVSDTDSLEEGVNGMLRKTP